MSTSQETSKRILIEEENSIDETIAKKSKNVTDILHVTVKQEPVDDVIEEVETTTVFSPYLLTNIERVDIKEETIDDENEDEPNIIVPIEKVTIKEEIGLIFENEASTSQPTLIIEEETDEKYMEDNIKRNTSVSYGIFSDNSYCSTCKIHNINLNEHLTQVHSTTCYPCQHCKESFVNIYFYKEHLTSTHNICIVCNSQFQSSSALFDHVQEHENIGSLFTFICKSCIKRSAYRTAECLLKHFSTVHNLKRELMRKEFCHIVLNFNYAKLIYQSYTADEIHCFYCSDTTNITRMSEHLEIHNVFVCNSCKHHIYFTDTMTFRKCKYCNSINSKDSSIQFDMDDLENWKECENCYEFIEKDTRYHNCIKHILNICGGCNFQFDTPNELSIHRKFEIKNYINTEDMPCVRCCLRFPNETKTMLYNHLIDTHFICYKCNEAFEDENELNIHDKNKHGNNMVKVFKCGSCNYNGITMSSIVVHLSKNHISTENFKPIEIKEITTTNEFEPETSCPYCPYKVLDTSEFFQHLSEAHAVVFCEFCHKFVNDPCNHAYEKYQDEYPCLCCHKSFLFTKILRHMVDEHNYCPYCGIYFKDKIILAIHFKDHSNTVSKEERQEIFIKCRKCSYVTQDISIMILHLNSYHPGLKANEITSYRDQEVTNDTVTFQCPYCLNVPGSSDEFRKHLLEKHGISYCSKCKKYSITNCKHLTNSKDIDVIIPCNFCIKPYPHTILFSHFLTKHNYCYVCSICLPNYQQLIQHINEHIKHEIKILTCMLCEYTDKTDKGILNHYLTRHAIKGQTSKEHQIKVKAKIYKMDRFQISKFRCPCCTNITLENNKKLLEHLFKTHAIDAYRATIRSNPFYNLDIKCGIRFPCLICYKIFDKNLLNDHINEHFFCYECNEQFNDEMTYQSHTIDHMENRIRLYTCDYCNFNSLNNLLVVKEHITNEHKKNIRRNFVTFKVLPKTLYSNFKYQCCYCCEYLQSSQTYTLHLKNKHSVIFNPNLGHYVKAIKLSTNEPIASTSSSNKSDYNVVKPSYIPKASTLLKKLPSVEVTSISSNTNTEVLPYRGKKRGPKRKKPIEEYVSKHSKAKNEKRQVSKFPCLFCPNAIIMSELQTHLIEKHYYCCNCNYAFKNEKLFDEHIEQHKKEKVIQYMCDECQFKCFDADTLKEHGKMNHKNSVGKMVLLLNNIKIRKYLGTFNQCPYCCDLLANTKKFVTHLLDSHDVRITIIKGEVFTYIDENGEGGGDMSENLNLNDEGFPIPDKSLFFLHKFPCIKCEKYFDPIEMYTHLQKRHYYCVNCEECFINSRKLHSHYLDHDKGEIIDYYCSECFYICREKEEILAHIELDHSDVINTNDTNFEPLTRVVYNKEYEYRLNQCPFCCILLQNQQEFIVHIATVHDFDYAEDPNHVKKDTKLNEKLLLPCFFCMKNFNIDKFNEHLITKHNYCHMCDEKFQDSNFFKSHKEKHENGIIMLNLCQLCDFKTKDNNEIINHISSLHSLKEDIAMTYKISKRLSYKIYKGEEEIQCPYCCDEIMSYDALLYHFKKHHAVKEISKFDNKTGKYRYHYISQCQLNADD